MPDSSKLKAQHKFCVKEMKKKPVTFCFLKLKAKENANSPLGNHREKGDFPLENLGLFFQS